MVTKKIGNERDSFLENTASLRKNGEENTLVQI